MDRETEFVEKEGNNATLLCEVKGDPEPEIHWLFKDVKVDFGETFKFYILFFIHSSGDECMPVCVSLELYVFLYFILFPMLQCR